MALRSPQQGSEPPAETDQYSLSNMAPGDESASGMPPDEEAPPDEQTIGAPDPNAGIALVVESTRMMEQSLTEVATAFPDAANEVRRAQAAVRGVLQRVVQIAGGQQQGPSPMLG